MTKVFFGDIILPVHAKEFVRHPVGERQYRGIESFHERHSIGVSVGLQGIDVVLPLFYSKRQGGFNIIVIIIIIIIVETNHLPT